MKKIVVVGALAGGIALAGLGGSAYADGGTASPTPAKPVKVAEPGSSVSARPGLPGQTMCVAKGKALKTAEAKRTLLKRLAIGKGTLRPGQKIIREKTTGRVFPAPPPGKKGTVHVIVKGHPGKFPPPLPGGGHCVTIRTAR